MAHQSDCGTLLHRAIIDTGAKASTTHVKCLLHKFEKIPFENYMADAVNTRHRSLGYGYLKIVTNDNDGTPTRFSLVHCWYTPTLRHTFFSPGANVRRHRKRFTSCTTCTNFALGNGHATLHGSPPRNVCGNPWRSDLGFSFHGALGTLRRSRMRLLSHAYATSQNKLPLFYGINVYGMPTCDIWPAYINMSKASRRSSFHPILKAATLAGLASCTVLLEEPATQ
jgi:hypothetical protein